MNPRTLRHRLLLTGLSALLAAKFISAEPLALRGYADGSRKSFTLIWEAVQPAGAGYNVYRRSSLRGTPVKINAYQLAVPVFADRVDGQTFYYSVRSVGPDRTESADSLILDSSPAMRLYYVASDGQTVLTMPASSAVPLQPGKNEWGVPLTIAMTEEPVDGSEGVVRSLRFQFVRGDTREKVEGGSLANCEAAVSIGTNSLQDSPEHLSVYWNNGARWIKIGGTLDHASGTLSVASSQLGRYQLRIADRANAIALETSNVFPSLITPNGDGFNDRVFFVLENPNNAAVRGEIRDDSGRFVSELAPGQSGGVGTTLVWTGHDANGSTVPSGLYVYRVIGDGNELTGTVAVAR